MKISVSNFLAFNGTYEFDLRKITLFVGANNTGKSTLAKFFKWMKSNATPGHMPTFITKNNILDFDQGQASIQRRFLNLLNHDSVTQELDVNISFRYFGSDISCKISYVPYSGSTNSVNEREIGPLHGVLSSMKISWNNKILYEQNGEDNDETLFFTNFAFMLNYYITLVNKCQNNDVFDEVPYAISALFDENDSLPVEFVDWLKKAKSVKFRSNGKLIENVGQFPILDFEMLGEITPLIQRKISELSNSFWFVLKVLKELKGVIVSSIANNIVLDKAGLIDDDIDVAHITNRNLSKYFNLKFHVEPKLDKDNNYFGNVTTIQTGKRNMNISDMGDGIKTILPLLNKIVSNGYDDFIENSSNRKQKGCFFISEPENTMHPNWQKQFMDYLIDDRFDNYVVETHSLIIIRSLQLAVAEGRISADDVAIYDFYENEDGSKGMQRINILHDGQLDGKIMNGFDELVNDMELKLWRIAQNKLSVN
jgi:predicted ATPase